MRLSPIESFTYLHVIARSSLPPAKFQLHIHRKSRESLKSARYTLDTTVTRTTVTRTALVARHNHQSTSLHPSGPVINAQVSSSSSAAYCESDSLTYPTSRQVVNVCHCAQLNASTCGHFHDCVASHHPAQRYLSDASLADKCQNDSTSRDSELDCAICDSLLQERDPRMNDFAVCGGVSRSRYRYQSPPIAFAPPWKRRRVVPPRQTVPTTSRWYEGGFCRRTHVTSDSFSTPA